MQVILLALYTLLFFGVLALIGLIIVKQMVVSIPTCNVAAWIMQLWPDFHG